MTWEVVSLIIGSEIVLLGAVVSIFRPASEKKTGDCSEMLETIHAQIHELRKRDEDLATEIKETNRVRSENMANLHGKIDSLRVDVMKGLGELQKLVYERTTDHA